MNIVLIYISESKSFLACYVKLLYTLNGMRYLKVVPTSNCWVTRFSWQVDDIFKRGDRFIYAKLGFLQRMRVYGILLSTWVRWSFVFGLRHYSDVIMRDGVSKHRRLDGLLNHLFRQRPKKTSKLRVTGLCEGHSPVTPESPAQRTSNTENISIWWRHHEFAEHDTTLTLHITKLSNDICSNSLWPSDAIWRHRSRPILA